MENLEPYFRVEYFLADAIEAAKNRGGGGGPTPGPTPPEPTPEPPDPNADVLFYDYDGTITNSYTATEFAALTAMPDNPTHQGLTAQGWNWSLADAKDYVSKYGMLDIGQMYITDDGKTRIYIHLTEGRTSPMLGLGVNGSVVVDWGDGSTETLTGGDTGTVVWTEKHNYTSTGDYVIALTVNGIAEIVGDGGKKQGCALLRYSSGEDDRNENYRNAITKVEIGEKITIGESALLYCENIASVTIPQSSSIYMIPSNGIYQCKSLTAVVLPSGLTTIGEGAFPYSENLKTVIFPASLTSFGNYAFSYCHKLASAKIPPLITNVSQGVFHECSSMVSVVIPDGVTVLNVLAFNKCGALVSATIPASVERIYLGAFSSCYGIETLKFESTVPPQVLSSDAWTEFNTDCIIYVPSGSLTAYTSATNYPDPTTYQYVEY